MLLWSAHQVSSSTLLEEPKGPIWAFETQGTHADVEQTLCSFQRSLLSTLASALLALQKPPNRRPALEVRAPRFPLEE